jgi:hypothetical protein
MNRTTEKIPTWSLAYIINGDATALTDDEVQTIDRWMKQWQVQNVSPSQMKKGTHSLISPITPFSDFPQKWKIARYFI